jgi:hypothetical protein
MSKKQTIKRAAKRSKDVQVEANPQVHKKLSVNKGGQHNCRYCPPFEFENKVARKPKRGAKKPKHKNKRG